MKITENVGGDLSQKHLPNAWGIACRSDVPAYLLAFELSGGLMGESEAGRK
jgi:hypothetical protein